MFGVILYLNAVSSLLSIYHEYCKSAAVSCNLIDQLLFAERDDSDAFSLFIFMQSFKHIFCNMKV